MSLIELLRGAPLQRYYGARFSARDDTGRIALILIGWTGGMAEEDDAMSRVKGHMRQVAPLVLPASLASIHACLWREALRGSVHRRSIALRHTTIRPAPAVLKALGHASLNVLPGLSGAAPARSHKRIGHIDGFVKLLEQVLTITSSNGSGASSVRRISGTESCPPCFPPKAIKISAAPIPFGWIQTGERWALWYNGRRRPRAPADTLPCLTRGLLKLQPATTYRNRPWTTTPRSNPSTTSRCACCRPRTAR